MIIVFYIIAPPPSPRTKPSLSLSNGLEAVSGESFLSQSAFKALKPPTPVSLTADSEPPVIMISDVPDLM